MVLIEELDPAPDEPIDHGPPDPVLEAIVGMGFARTQAKEMLELAGGEQHRQ